MSILIVEDEQAPADSMCQYPGSEHFQCDGAADYPSALAKMESREYDCIISDIGLPGGSGLQLLAALKADKKEDGVLIISARDSLGDKVKGLRMGADDYLTKPFHLSGLSAGLDAIIRRKSFDGATLLQYDLPTLDLQKATVLAGNDPVELTRREYELLLYFVSNKPKVISKSALAGHL